MTVAEPTDPGRSTITVIDPLAGLSTPLPSAATSATSALNSELFGPTAAAVVGTGGAGEDPDTAEIVSTDVSAADVLANAEAAVAAGDPTATAALSELAEKLEVSRQYDT